MDTRSALSVLRTSLKKQWIVVTVFAVMTFLALVLMTGVTMFTNRVYITDGENVKCILTTDENLDDIFKNNDYTIGDDDIVEFDGFQDDVGEVSIIRAFNVKVTCDGQTKEIPIARGTVSDVLTKGNIIVNDDDLLNIGLTEQANANTDIIIQRVTYEQITTESAIAFETTQVMNPNLAKSSQVVTTEGQDGVLQTITKNTYTDGVQTATSIEAQTVTKEPVGQVITVGTARRTPVSQNAPETLTLDANGVPTSYSKVLTGKSAAYSAPAGARTASGRVAKVGNVAVNPNVIPYGTKLYITSTNGQRVYGYAIAADTGGALASGRIMVDLFFDSYQASCNWGIQQVNIYILN